MPIDVAGRRHPYMFSTMKDAGSGLSFTPVSGTANLTKFRVEGPNVPANTFMESRAANARVLAMEYHQRMDSLSTSFYGY